MNLKSFYILVFLFLSVFCYSQNIKFQPNTNYKARNLKQGLNISGDSLILESSKKPIRQVDIFNEDFLETIEVDSTKTKINLSILPAGNFIVKARLGRKRIIMYLQKRESPIVAYSAEGQKDKDITSSKINPTATAKNKKKKKDVNYYWAVEKSNSSFGSYKTMRLVYKNEVSNMIEKNKLELASDIGKDNTLVIYAIYNKNKFMKKQYRNSEHYKSVKKSKHFNVVPFYSSNNKVDNNPNS